MSVRPGDRERSRPSPSCGLTGPAPTPGSQDFRLCSWKTKGQGSSQARSKQDRHPCPACPKASLSDNPATWSENSWGGSSPLEPPKILLPDSSGLCLQDTSGWTEARPQTGISLSSSPLPCSLGPFSPPSCPGRAPQAALENLGDHSLASLLPTS